MVEILLVASGPVFFAALVGFLVYMRWLRANPSRYVERLRRRLGARQVLIPMRDATWSRTCWRCAAPCERRRRVELRRFATALVASAAEGLEIAVPICEEHGPPPRLPPLVRILRLPVGLGLFAAIAVGAAMSRHAPQPGLRRTLALVVGIAVGYTVARLMRAWADRREPLHLVWTDPGLGWCIVGLDDPERAARIRAELDAATGRSAES